MELIDHIGVFHNHVPADLCRALIESFETWSLKKYEIHEHSFNDGAKQFKGEGSMQRKDSQLFLETVDLPLSMKLNGYIGQCFEEYVSVYNGLTQDNDPVSSWTTKVQKTEAGGGYHKWHCEDGVFMYRDRVLTWMVYLNDIKPEQGGATEFLYQKKAIHPSEGTVVLWPAAYTHMHRAGFLVGDTPKYIATGWFLREPGNVTSKVLSEA